MKTKSNCQKIPKNDWDNQNRQFKKCILLCMSHLRFFFKNSVEDRSIQWSIAGVQGLKFRLRIGVTENSKIRESKNGHPTNFCLLTSNFQLRASNFQLRASNFQLRASNFFSLSSHIKLLMRKLQAFCIFKPWKKCVFFLLKALHSS